LFFFQSDFTDLRFHHDLVLLLADIIFTFQQDSAPVQPTMPERLLHCCRQRLLTSSVRWSGHRTARIWIR